MIAFGIDPGSHRTGWGVVRRDGSRLVCLDYGVIAAGSSENLGVRLKVIFSGVTDALRRANPNTVFVESVFHHRSAKSALILGQARGVALLASQMQCENVDEVAPAEVKKAVTGSGRADKHQVQEMVRVLLGLPKRAPSDASDALAIAIAGVVRSNWTTRVTSAQRADALPIAQPGESI